MPGRTPAEAFKSFIEPLRGAVACVARCHLTVTPNGPYEVGQIYNLLSNRGDAIDLGSPNRLQLRTRMRYEIVRLDDLESGPYKVRTIAYAHTVSDQAGSGVLAYHWHPDGQSHVRDPHLHIGTNQLSDHAILTNKNHVATGRVSFESVIRQLITDHGVEPRCGDWEERLALSEGLFQLHRSWG